MDIAIPGMHMGGNHNQPGTGCLVYGLNIFQ